MPFTDLPSGGKIKCELKQARHVLCRDGIFCKKKKKIKKGGVEGDAFSFLQSCLWPVERKKRQNRKTAQTGGDVEGLFLLVANKCQPRTTKERAL